MVVETMKKEHLSIYAAMQEFGINDHKIIERWERSEEHTSELQSP